MVDSDSTLRMVHEFPLQDQSFPVFLFEAFFLFFFVVVLCVHFRPTIVSSSVNLYHLLSHPQEREAMFALIKSRAATGGGGRYIYG